MGCCQVDDQIFADEQRRARLRRWQSKEMVLARLSVAVERLESNRDVRALYAVMEYAEQLAGASSQ